MSSPSVAPPVLPIRPSTGPLAAIFSSRMGLVFSVLTSLNGVVSAAHVVRDNFWLCTIGLALGLVLLGLAAMLARRLSGSDGAVWLLNLLTGVMAVVLGVLIGLFLLLPVSAVSVTISEPANGATVSEFWTVRGQVSVPASRVVLVVRPVRTAEYWIQAKPTVGADGSWTAPARFGQNANGVGEDFEISAYAIHENVITASVNDLLVSPGSRFSSLPVRFDPGAPPITVKRAN
jgi:hypothetical protein